MSSKKSNIQSMIHTVGVVAVCVVLSAIIKGNSEDFWYSLLAVVIGVLVIFVAGYKIIGPGKHSRELTESKQRHEKLKAEIARCMNSSKAEAPPKRRPGPSSVEMVRQAEQETLRQRRHAANADRTSEPARRGSDRREHSPQTQLPPRPPRPQQPAKPVRASNEETVTRPRKSKDVHSLPLFVEEPTAPDARDLVADDFFL